MRQSSSTHNRMLFLVFPACAMSLGWAFRGFIGGGPLGAMIPGAMVAIAIAWLLGRRGEASGVVAAFGAIGIGFGGQMTYGQTVGLASDPATMVWGLAGLSLKGAVWGLLGGAVVSLGLTIRRYTRRQVIVGLAVMVMATWTGWRIVNQPKLVYFSNLLDRPREEVWAGLLAGALALLAWLMAAHRNTPLLRFSLAAFVSGGLGFGLGGALLAAGRNSSLDASFWPWWKGMEYTFGFLFGLALGWAAWRSREELAEPLPEARSSALRGTALLAVTLLLVGVGIGFEYAVDLRFNYSIIGAALLLAALCDDGVGWHLAITMTYTAFVLDLVEAFPTDRGFGVDFGGYGIVVTSGFLLWTGIFIAVGTSMIMWASLERWRTRETDLLPRALLLLTMSAFAVTTAKTAIQAMLHPGPHVEYWMFVATTILVLVIYKNARDAKPIAVNA